MTQIRNDFVKVVNSLTGETNFMLKSELEKYEHKIDPQGNIFFIPNKKQPEQPQMNKPYGCSPWFFIAFTGLMALGCFLIMKKSYNDYKRHINVISYINNEDKKIIITDVATNEERFIDFSGYNVKPRSSNMALKFYEMVEKSNIGDTVAFVSPDYETRRKFVLDKSKYNKNTLYLNSDSIFARIRAEQTQSDSLQR